MTFKHSSIKTVLLTSFCITTIVCQQSPYKTTRYEQFITESVAGLEAKKNMLEKKMVSSKEQIAQTLKKQSGTRQSAARSTQYKTIIDASQAVIEGLNAAHTHVLAQLKRVNEEKSDLSKLNITNAQDEDRSLQKAKLKLSIADLEQQIEQTHRAENFFEKQPSELKTRTTLMGNWAAKRNNLQMKLRNEQIALQNLK